MPHDMLIRTQIEHTLPALVVLQTYSAVAVIAVCLDAQESESDTWLAQRRSRYFGKQL